MKKSIFKIVQITVLLVLSACNPKEPDLIFSEPQPITDIDDTDGDDGDDANGDDTPQDGPTNAKTVYMADIFFIDRNILYGIRDDFFEPGHQGTGEITTPFLEISLPSDGQIDNLSTPFLFMSNPEASLTIDNLRLAVASTDGTISTYRVTDEKNQTWSEVWSFTLNNGFFASPTALGFGPTRSLYLGDIGGAVYSLKANIDGINWAWQNPGNLSFFIAPLEVVPQSNLVVAASYGGEIFGLDAQNGNLLWSYDTTSTISAKPFHPDNAVDGINSVIVATEEGMLFRLNTNDGTLIWKIALPPDRFSSTQTQFLSSAPSSDGTNTGFFIASANRTVFNINIETGAINWDTGENRLDSFRSSINSLDSSFAVGIGSFGTLYQFTRTGANNDQVNWTELQLPNANESGINGSPLIVLSGQNGYDANRIYVKTAIGLYGIDQRDTEIASKFEFGSGIGDSGSSPIAIGTNLSDNSIQVFYAPNNDDDNLNISQP